MNKRPANFTYQEKVYKAEYSWSLSQPQRTNRIVLAFPKLDSQKSFMLSKNSGLMVCEDYQHSSTLSDLQTEKMQVYSIDYCPCSEPLSVVAFSSGHILLINPILRKRGKIVWFNTRRNIYANRPPTICRWLNQDQFIVLFGDNIMWKFDKTLQGEDEKFIQAAQNNAKDCAKSIISMPLPYPESNPVQFWKLQLGKIRDMKVCPSYTSSLICINTELDMKIVDLSTNSLVVTLKSYFAGFQSVCWSGDGELIIAGGEDDCIHIWSTVSWSVLFRGIGHFSWVSGVNCRLENNQYIISSVGHDCNLCIWEFPKGPCKPEELKQGSTIEYPSKTQQTTGECCMRVKVSEEPLVDIKFHSDSYFICDVLGNVHQWIKSSE